MKIARKSPRTGQINTLELNITLAQLDSYYHGGVLLQHAFPNLSKAEREFIKTGYTQDDWDAIFGPEIDPALLEGGSAEASTLFGPLESCLRKYGKSLVPPSFTAGKVQYYFTSMRQNGEGEVLAWHYRGDDAKESEVIVFND